MTIAKDTEAEILRLYHAEGWRQGTIASQLQIHYATVARVLARNGLIPKPGQVRRSIVDPYLPFIKSTLEKYP